MTVLDEAIIYAAVMHSGTNRKGSDTPYIVHPMEAAAVVATMTSDKELMAAAALHDVVEDTTATVEDISLRFGERVACLVAAESENKNFPPNAEGWKARKAATIAHLSSADCPLEVKIVALGDKLSNIRAMKRDYDALGDKLWERFHVHEKALHGWYYTSLVTALSELKDTAAYKEFAFLVNEVFGND